MRKSMKKLLFGILACAFMIAAFAWVKPQTLQAAPAMAKTDFTKSYGKPKVNFVKFCKDNGYVGPGSWAWYSVYSVKNDNEGTEIKNYATNRKIKLKKSTKKNVLKQYGSASVNKVNVKYDYIYKACGSATASGKAQRKAIKNSKTYVDYIYFDRKEGCEYRLRFYFTKKDKVNMVVYIKNHECIEMYFENRER